MKTMRIVPAMVIMIATIKCTITILIPTAITMAIIKTIIATAITCNQAPVIAMKTIIAVINKNIKTDTLTTTPVKAMEIIAVLNNTTKMEQPFTQVWKTLDHRLKVR